MNHTKQRFLGLDLLKIATLVAIAILHANEFVFFQDNFPHKWESPIWQLSSYYARFFAIGGQVLVSLIYFLFGYTRKKRLNLIKSSFFAFLGQISLYLAFETVEWDIYTFIIVANLSIVSVPFFFNKNKATLVVCIIFLIISPTTYANLFNDYSLMSILTGHFHLSPSGSWPLIPWLFLAILFYQIGIFASESLLFSNWIKAEKIIWFFAFILSTPFLGHYYFLPIGPNFYRFAFYQEPHIFFSNLIPFIFLGRVSLLSKTQNFLKKKEVFHFLSHLNWTKHLGLTYLISIVYLGFGARHSEYFYKHPFSFDIFYLGIIPGSEYLSRLVISTIKKVSLK